MENKKKSIVDIIIGWLSPNHSEWAAYIYFTIGSWLITSVLMMLAWNFVMPAIFGLKTINLWQALCLNVLLYIFRGGNKTISTSKE